MAVSPQRLHVRRMSQQNAQNPASRALVMATILFYLFAALSMVVANKWVLNTTEAPLFFLFAQLLIAVVLFLATNAMGLIDIPIVLDVEVCKGLIPVVALNVIGLSFSNYTLKYVDASFYQVARGLVLPLTVCTSFLFLHTRPSIAILFSCSIVTLGFFIGVFFDGAQVSPLGVFFGVGSSMITAVHAVIIKKGLELVNGNAIHFSWYANLMSTVVLGPLVFLAGEGGAVYDLMFGEDTMGSGGFTAMRTFIWGSVIAGTLGFLMSIAALLSIKVTSPITHMVTSAVRGVFATLLGMWLFHDIITFGRATSIATILSGSIYYTWLKHLETAPPPPRSKGGYESVPLEDVEDGKVNERPE